MKKGLHAALLDAAAGISQKRQDAGEQEHRAQSNPEEVASTAILYYIEEILSVSLPLQAREPHHGVEEREKREQIQEIKIAAGGHGGDKHQQDALPATEYLLHAAEHQRKIPHGIEEIGMAHPRVQREAAERVAECPHERGKLPALHVKAVSGKRRPGQIIPEHRQERVALLHVRLAHGDGENQQRIAETVVIQGGHHVAAQPHAQIHHGKDKFVIYPQIPEKFLPVFTEIDHGGVCLVEPVPVPDEAAAIFVKYIKNVTGQGHEYKCVNCEICGSFFHPGSSFISARFVRDLAKCSYYPRDDSH